MSNPHIRFSLTTIILALGLFLGMMAFLEIGRRLGIRQLAKYGKDAIAAVGKADAPVYGLLALLLGFTFNGAAVRFDHRRELIAQQVNALSTVWSRIDLLPAAAQPEMRAAYRRYVEAILATYDDGFSAPNPLIDPEPVVRTRDALWGLAVQVTTTPEGERARMLLLPALNESFDVADHERLARQIHPSLLIYAMLGIVALASALFAGVSLSSAPTRSLFYMVGIAATVASALFVTIELEYPRRGMIRVDDMAAAELRLLVK